MRIFRNRFCLLAILFGVMQQVVVASSTYFITRMGGSVASGGPFLLWCVLFFASLVAVFVPAFACDFFLNKAKYRSFADCIATCGKQLYNRPALRSSRKFCETRQPYFNNQCWSTVDEACNFYNDLLQVLCSVVCNVAVISAMLDPLFLLGYGGSLLVAAVALLLSRKAMRNLSAQAQHRQAHMQEALLSGWDTILTGNRCNFRAWRHSFVERAAAAQNGQQRAVTFTCTVNLLAMALSVLPVAGVILHFYFANQQNPTALTMLAVTLPRQVSIVQYLSVLIEYAMTMTGLLARLRQLQAAMQAPADECAFSGRTDWSRMRLYSRDGVTQPSSLAELQRCTGNFARGRYTLRGDNGSGKSTALMQLKAQLGDRACYLPATSNLYFKTTAHEGCSTGEKLLLQLRELLASPDSAQVAVLLLDEWDANLDAANVARVSALLDQVAAQKCVLEIRHRSA